MRIPLDDAIDRVATRMTAVEQDDALALRIVRSLPERSVWLPRVWISRFAMGALATVAIVGVLRPFDHGAPGVGPAQAGHHNANVTAAQAGHHNANVTAAQAGHHKVNVTAAQAGHHKVSLDPVDALPSSVSVVSAFRRTGSGTVVDRPDHEFSLPAIEAVAALGVEPLTPSELALEPVLVLAPLEIADLPLSSDFSPR